jgi:hypothetical protein
MNGTNYAEIVEAQCEHGMTLPEWRQCRGDPWRFSRGHLCEDAGRQRFATKSQGNGVEQRMPGSPILFEAEFDGWSQRDARNIGINQD